MPRRVLLSWSSGKDSAWTLHVLRAQPHTEVVGLLTTVNTEHGRVAMHATRREILEAIFETEDAQTWLARFRAAGVPCAPINTYSEVLADPQVEHMGWVQPVDLPNGVRTRTFGLPVRFDGQTTALRRRPPALGEHNDEVLKELGYSDDEIAALGEANVIANAPAMAIPPQILSMALKLPYQFYVPTGILQGIDEDYRERLGIAD